MALDLTPLPMVRIHWDLPNSYIGQILLLLLMSTFAQQGLDLPISGLIVPVLSRFFIFIQI